MMQLSRKSEHNYFNKIKDKSINLKIECSSEHKTENVSLKT